MRPLKVLEKLDIETTIVQCNEYGEIDIGGIEKEIKKETALIAATHASNVVGTIIPIEDIGALAKRYGLAFLVDASQTAGVYDIDMQKMNISMLAFAGHKSLMGPQGTGGLCIKRGLELTPLQEGGTGSKSESLYQPDICLLYTSDAADDLLCVDLGGRSIIKKKKHHNIPHPSS